MFRTIFIVSCGTALFILALTLNLKANRDAGVRSHISSGIAFLSDKKYDKAVGAWREALRLDPQMPDAYLLLSEYYISSGQSENAIPLLERLKKIAPATPLLYTKLAEAYTVAGKPDEAFAAAKEAVKNEPESPEAHALLGIQLANRASVKEGVAELSRAVLLAPENPRILTSLAQAQLDAGDFVGAEASARNALKKSPDFQTAWFVLGFSYSRRNPSPENLREAITAFERLAQLAPDRGDGLSELGRLYNLAGRPADARKTLEALWRKGFKSDEIAFNLAKAYRLTGDQKRSLQMTAEFNRISQYTRQHDDLTKQMISSSNRPEVALKLVKLETEAKNFEGAVPLLEKLLQINPGDLETLKAAIKVYEGLGNQKAVEFYRQKISRIKLTGVAQ